MHAMLFTGEGLEVAGGIWRELESGRITEALNGKLKNLIFTYVVYILIYIIFICLFF